MGPVGITLLVGLGVLLLWGVMLYNALVRRRNEIGNAFAQIDVQLKRRHDLVPNLVETARGYLQHEAQTLQAVTEARAGADRAAAAARRQPTEAAAIGALAGAEATLGGLLSKLMLVVEAYPQLKADATMRELSDELAHTENRIAFSRQAFNDAVLDYNNAAQQVPANVVAAVCGFRAAAMLESTRNESEREPVRVRF